MAYPDNALASHIASQTGGWTPQLEGMAVIQLLVPSSVTSGDMNTIMLATRGGDLPARTMGSEHIPYMQGYSSVATKLDAPGDFTLTLMDYVDVSIYDLMHDWGELVTNQNTGWGGFPSIYKSTGTYITFGPAPVGGVPQYIKRWELVGIWPKTKIPSRKLTYDSNAPVQLAYSFTVDNYLYLGQS